MTTANSLIDRAYSLLGYKDPGEALSGADAAYALSALNDMIDSWNTQGYFIVTVSDVVTTVSGLPITIGPSMAIDVPRPTEMKAGAFVRSGGVDFPIEWISREEYDSITVKSISSNIPAYGYYDAGLPTGNIYLWPYSLAGAELHLPLNSSLSEFADLSTDYNLAPGYRKAISYSLAEELSPGVRELPAQVAKQAFLARKAIRRTNVRVPLLDLGTAYSPLARFLSGL